MLKDRSRRLPTFGHAEGVDAVAASAWWRQWRALRLRLASFLPLSVRNWRLALRIRRLPDRV
jgi:hypothetical protein